MLHFQSDILLKTVADASVAATPRISFFLKTLKKLNLCNKSSPLDPRAAPGLKPILDPPLVEKPIKIELSEIQAFYLKILTDELLRLIFLDHITNILWKSTDKMLTYYIFDSKFICQRCLKICFSIGLNISIYSHIQSVYIVFASFPNKNKFKGPTTEY